MRRCYVCGRDRSRGLIVEPLMLPVCSDRECKQRAAQLPPHHCSARLSNGHICGAQAAPDFEIEGRELCAQHLQLLWQREDAARQRSRVRHPGAG
jgi:hypothetical protein